MNPYYRLLISNKGLGQFKSAAVDNDAATVYLYDAIVSSEIEADYFGGVDPKQFAQALAGIKASTINLRVNSPGGSVFAARSMAQAIKDHPAKVIAHVDGLAASAASFLIMAADEIVMAEGSFIMIHNAWSMTIGNAEGLRQEADLLDTIDESLVKTYAKRTNVSKDDIRSMMADETWLDADQAVAQGFATSVAGQTTDPQMATQWDLSAYEKEPDAEPVIKADTEQDQRKRRIDLAKRALFARRTD